MKTTKIFLFLLSIGLLFNSCKKDDPQTQTIANVLTGGNFETPPTTWIDAVNLKSTSKPNSYSGDYSTEAASSPTHSIKISCSAAPSDSTYHLFQQALYTASTPIPTGAKLTFKAKIKTVNMQGEGISMAMGGNKGVNDNYASAFFTETRGKVAITVRRQMKVDKWSENGKRQFVKLFHLNHLSNVQIGQIIPV